MLVPRFENPELEAREHGYPGGPESACRSSSSRMDHQLVASVVVSNSHCYRFHHKSSSSSADTKSSKSNTHMRQPAQFPGNGNMLPEISD